MLIRDQFTFFTQKVFFSTRSFFSSLTSTPRYDDPASTCLYLKHPLLLQPPSNSLNKQTENDTTILDENPIVIQRNLLPQKDENALRLVIISDTHGKEKLLGKIPPCDIFIHCGDILLTSRMFSREYNLKSLKKFNNWLGKIDAKWRIVIGGNHDRILEKLSVEECQKILFNANYLHNSYVKCNNISIFATPFSHGYSSNMAFQSNEFLTKTMQTLPALTDILITHGNSTAISSKINNHLHLYGHQHNSFGIYKSNEKVFPMENSQFPSLLSNGLTKYSINGVVLDGSYKQAHPIVVIDMPNKSILSNDILDSIPSLPSVPTSPKLTAATSTSSLSPSSSASPSPSNVVPPNTILFQSEIDDTILQKVSIKTSRNAKIVPESF